MGISKEGELVGLDIIFYSKQGNQIKIGEIEESMHEAIFIKNNNWGSYKYLKKIKDYYLTDVEFKGEDLNCFINDLKGIRIFIDKDYAKGLNDLIRLLENEKVGSIRINGD